MRNPYDTGSADGFLLDRNGDGHPDDLAVRIVLPADADRLGADVWCALVDLGARLGLETTGLPERLVLGAGESLPPECVPFVVDADATPEHVRAFATAGLPLDATGAVADDASPGISDLAALFTPSGLLRDRDGDRLPDGTRLALVLPDPCPTAIGIAAIEFAARVGLESGGIDFPIAVVAGAEVPAGAAVLELSVGGPSGPARLELNDRGLRVDGDESGTAALLAFLASTWPALSGEGGAMAEAHVVAAAVRDIVTAATPLGRAALLGARVATDSAIRLHSDDREELRLARLLCKDASTKPDWDDVFSLDWEERWEVERVRDLIRDELIPSLAVAGDAGPIDLLVLISETGDIRRALASEFNSLLAQALPDGQEFRVRVRSAYKAGLSWVREDVVPALSQLTGIDRVEFRYAPVPTAGDGQPPRLDLPVRWLQELYPGDEFVAAALGLPLDAVDLVERSPEDGAIYEIVAFRDGEAIWGETFSPRWYELPYVSLDPARGSVLVSTGGIRATRGKTVFLDRDVPTDCDRFWTWFQGEVLPRVGEHVREVTGGLPRLADQPFFASLRVDAWVSEPNESLGIREELDSAAEALHEDVYFGALDWLAAFGTSLGGDEPNGPGAIQPFIHVVPGQGPRARVSLRARRRFVGETMAADGEMVPIAPLVSLPTPDVKVTGLSVGPDGLAGLDVSLDWPADADPELVGALLRTAASLLAANLSERPMVPITVHVDSGEPVAIAFPISGDEIAGVEPSPDPPSDRQILFGDDLPPLLARLRARPGVKTRQIGRSFQGRPMWALELTAPMPTRRWSPAKLSLRKPTLLAIGRHHANEVASTTAAFVLAERLTGDPEWRPLLDSLNVVILPFANPDGAALHRELIAENPTWKHHAARYNAVGLEFIVALFDDHTPFGEARARRSLWERWLPDVVVDNHGVPSHEWSQHFAGFGSPPRFSTCYWMVQALLYGIVTHPETPEHTPFAQELRRRLARAVRETSDFAAADRVYGHRYARWGTSRVPDRFPAEFEDDFLCYFKSAAPDPASRNFALRYPATTTLDWVTEVPDETAHGEHLALTAQAHLIANEAMMRLMAELPPPVERVVERRGGDAVTVRLLRRRPL